jgi:hypothetical protein
MRQNIDDVPRIHGDNTHDQDLADKSGLGTAEAPNSAWTARGFTPAPTPGNR